MEMEYKDPSRRGRYIVIIGVILAIVAGGAAFYLISSAQQQAGQAGLQRVSVVVALQTIPARKLIEATDVEVREVPLDPTNALGIVSTPDKVIGRVPSVTVLRRPDGHHQPARLEHRGRPVLRAPAGRDGRPGEPAVARRSR